MPHKANIQQSSGLFGENSLSLLKDQRSERLEHFPRWSTKIRRLNEWILGLLMQSISASTFTPVRATVTSRRLRATNVQNSSIFADCSLADCGEGQQNQRDLALIPWAHNPKVGAYIRDPTTMPLESGTQLAHRIAKNPSKTAVFD